MDAAEGRELDALERLEAKILQAAGEVQRFREEAAEARRQVAALTREVDELRRERQQVRGRIEKLLVKLDGLDAA
jgi:FtsZ-binding cell division protein ZapB